MNFDAKRILSALSTHDLVGAFTEVTVTKDVLPEEYNAHNAAADVDILQKIRINPQCSIILSLLPVSYPCSTMIRSRSGELQHYNHTSLPDTSAKPLQRFFKVVHGRNGQEGIVNVLSENDKQGNPCVTRSKTCSGSSQMHV